jgi:hypothetical protein
MSGGRRPPVEYQHGRGGRVQQQLAASRPNDLGQAATQTCDREAVLSRGRFARQRGLLALLDSI